MLIKAKIILCIVFSYFIFINPISAEKEIYKPHGIEKKKPYFIKKKIVKKPKFGKRIARYAKRFLGVPYYYGGETPRGFDCSGFVRFIYKHFHIYLPHNAWAQSNYGRWISNNNIMPGDLLFFNGFGHVGIYIGKGRMIHSPHSGSYVQIEKLSDRSKFIEARRIKSSD